VTDGDRDAALVTVRIVGLPLDVHRRASQQIESLRREFALINAAEGDESSVPARLISLMEELTTRFAPFTVGTTTRLAAALASGARTIDLEYEVPPDVAGAVTRLGELLDEADEYCRAGEHLLTLASTDDAVLYRRWFLDEFVRQADGSDPTPWRLRPGTAGPGAGEPETPHRRGEWTEEAVVALDAEVDLESAPALRQRLNDVLTAGTNRVVVDGSAVEFIDSLGVSVLMAAHARCQAEGVELAVEMPSRRLRDTLESLGVADLLL
jgi:anti-anti-sigma factor